MPKRADIKITDRLCRSAPPPKRGYTFHLCSETRGLALRVTAAGARSFVFSYSNPQGRQRRMTIGPYPEWSVAAARKRTHELRQAVNRGEDPLEARNQERVATTIGELWEWYEAHAFQKLAHSSQRDVRSAWSRLIIPSLGPNTSLADLHRRDVQRMVEQITDRSGPYQANRSHSFLRRVLNLAVAEGWMEKNVATMAVTRNVEQPRDRFLTREEFVQICARLEADPDVAAHCLRLIALTGCRKSEAIQARWDDVDLVRAVWTKPASNTKARRRHIVPLNDAAVQSLQQTKGRFSSDTWVFPGRAAGRPVYELRHAWRRACDGAGLSGVRIHDLRHTFASFIASNGGTLEIAGALLGHSQPATTARYAHLFDETLRTASNGVGLTVTDNPQD